MERAALAVRDEILHAFPIALKRCGSSSWQWKQWRDGIAIARLLHIAGVHVTILNIGNPKHASAEHQTQEKRSRTIIKFLKLLISLSLIRQH